MCIFVPCEFGCVVSPPPPLLMGILVTTHDTQSNNRRVTTAHTAKETQQLKIKSMGLVGPMKPCD